MAVISIETLIPSSGAVPSNGYDAVSLAGFTEWEVGDEARFSIVVPETYRAGNDFYLRIQESSPSLSLRHKWQVKTLLMRPEVNVTDEAAVTETFSLECQDASTADRLTTRTLPVTGSAKQGQVQDHVISPGDVLCFILRRVNASAQEDPAAIKVFDVSLVARVDDSADSDCAGRVGKIFDTVRDLFNEATGGFLPDNFILRSINRCLQDIGQHNYWRRETWMPAEAGENRVDLLEAIAGYQDVHQVHFSGQTAPMMPLGSFEEYEELKTGSNATGVPEYYAVQNDSMYVWPPPATNLASGFCAYHSYLPADLTCSEENPTPPLPAANDMLFVYFVLKQAFLRDRHAPGAEVKFQEYSGLYEQAKQRLLGEKDPPKLALRPYR
ncbi:MAG: hypothetical protein HY913_18905 [Desulfomonile tiedjei]|nr:hypothetical protein [Desulfomonile tiedjei]